MPQPRHSSVPSAQGWGVKAISLDLRETSWDKGQGRWEKGMVDAREGKGEACMWHDHMTTQQHLGSDRVGLEP